MRSLGRLLFAVSLVALAGCSAEPDEGGEAASEATSSLATKLAVTVDATALTKPTFQIDGIEPRDARVPQRLSLAPGAYHLRSGYPIDLAFTLQKNGTVEYAAWLDTYLAGRGTATLVLRPCIALLDAPLATTAKTTAYTAPIATYAPGLAVRDLALACGITHTYPQSNALALSVQDELNALSRSPKCVSFWLDTVQSQDHGFLNSEGENHHQGLARTQRLSNGQIYWFLSHSEIEGTGNLSQFRYAGATYGDRVFSSGATASLEQLLPLNDESPTEEHPSDIDFLAEIDGRDAGYVFVAKEYDVKAITVYAWSPGAPFARLGDIRVSAPGFQKPSHVFVDRVGNDYWLVAWDTNQHVGQAFRAYERQLFPTGRTGGLNLAAFQPVNAFSYSGDLGSQAKFVRDATGAFYVLVYRGDADGDVHGDDYLDAHAVRFAPDFQMLGRVASVHVSLPAGDTSFTSTGTHYVDRYGKLVVSSSYRWAEDQGDPYSYESRVDECARAW